MRSAVLSARRDAGGGLLLVELDVAADDARAYTTPGQYIAVKTEKEDGYFVLASEVGARPWELLVKNSGDAADALFSRALGTTFSIDGPLGAGFPFAQMERRHVVVAVAGSALAVARPVLSHRIARGQAEATHLFIGLRSPLDLPIRNEVEQWSDRGASVVLCLSKSELDHHAAVLPNPLGRARRVAGYVQAALGEMLETGEVPYGSLIIAAGPEAMLSDMRSLGTRHPRIEVLTNV